MQWLGAPLLILWSTRVMPIIEVLRANRPPKEWMACSEIKNLIKPSSWLIVWESREATGQAADLWALMKWIPHKQAWCYSQPTTQGFTRCSQMLAAVTINRNKTFSIRLVAVVSAAVLDQTTKCQSVRNSPMRGKPCTTEISWPSWDRAMRAIIKERTIWSAGSIRHNMTSIT